MEDGSCCGKWGLSQGQEGCARQPECTLCYNESFGQGYHAYFNDNELNFAKLVGHYWTTFSSGNPNAHSKRKDSMMIPFWPAIPYGGLVLDARLPNNAKVEVELYGNPKICEFWNKIG